MSATDIGKLLIKLLSLALPFILSLQEIFQLNYRLKFLLFFLWAIGLSGYVLLWFRDTATVRLIVYPKLPIALRGRTALYAMMLVLHTVIMLLCLQFCFYFMHRDNITVVAEPNATSATIIRFHAANSAAKLIINPPPFASHQCQPAELAASGRPANFFAENWQSANAALVVHDFIAPQKFQLQCQKAFAVSSMRWRTEPVQQTVLLPDELANQMICLYSIGGVLWLILAGCSAWLVWRRLP